MKEKIDFKKVADKVRFDLLGSISLPTPSEFQMLSDEEKARLYQQIFELHHDACCYLSSSLYLDELTTKYEEINAQNDIRNDAADEWLLTRDGDPLRGAIPHL